jgi:chromosome segregation protein
LKIFLHSDQFYLKYKIFYAILFHIIKLRQIPNHSKNLNKKLEKLQKDRETYNQKLEALSVHDKQYNEEYIKLKQEIEREKDSSRDAEKAVFRIMAEQNEIISLLNQLKNREERLHETEENFKRELQEAGILIGRSVFDFEHYILQTKEGWNISSEQILEEPRQMQDDRRKNIERIKIRLEDAGLGSGEDIIKEFDETKSRDEFLAREIEDLQKSAETLHTLIIDLEDRLTTEFKAGVDKINKQFQEYFALMFGGGNATLNVIKETKRRRKTEDELLGGDNESGEEFVEEEGEEGIDISVGLPQKRVKGLMMLSGGERALTSIALLFAISQVNPPPFIILDETDAALDEANSRKYGDMIDNLSKYSQLILITHNRETMSRASVLYGVTMASEGFSKLLSIKFDEAVEVAK